MGGFKVTWDDARVKALVKEAAMDGARAGAEHVKGESIKEVPLASGDLSGDCDTEDVNDTTVRIFYSLPYAIKQHEDLTLRHPDPTNPFSDPGRKAKYLEDPFRREKDKVLEMIADSVKAALKKG